jgi:hypothetical protein
MMRNKRKVIQVEIKHHLLLLFLITLSQIHFSAVGKIFPTAEFNTNVTASK